MGEFYKDRIREELEKIGDSEKDIQYLRRIWIIVSLHPKKEDSD